MAKIALDEATRLRVAWEQHHERLWRSLLAWSNDREIASDSVAEAFAQAARRGDETRDVGAWVWRAAFRIAAGQLQQARRSLPLTAARLPPVVDPNGAVPDLVTLLDGLAALHADDRQLVVLALVGGWERAAIADLMGITPGAARVRLHRALALLRASMEDDS